MTLTLTPAADAHALADERFRRNCSALGIDLPRPAVDFCTGVDGSDTAKRDGRFFAGCSVPRRAAELMVRKEIWKGRSLCLIVPTHGQQIAVVLERLGPTRALIVVPNAPDDLADFLTCVDFTAAIAAGRLLFASDADALEQLFVLHRGLAVPSQIVRLPDADATSVARVMPWAQATLSKLAGEHGQRLQAAANRRGTGVRSPRPAMLVGRQFRVWVDAGDTLASVGLDASVIDTDSPGAAADAFLAERAADAAAVITANTPRPAWALSPRPWVTWLTRPKIPAFNSSFARDVLLLADSAWLSLAERAGWPAARLAVAGWPVQHHVPTPGGPLALIADLPSLETPADLEESSGLKLIWEAIRDELPRDPFAVGDDATAYVRRAPGRLGLAAMDELPVERFVADLVGPAYLLGVAKWLAGENIALTLHGNGWQHEAALTGAWRGPIDSRSDLARVAGAACGLVDAFIQTTHPVRALSLPRVSTFGRTAQRLREELATTRFVAPCQSIAQPLSSDAIGRLIAGS